MWGISLNTVRLRLEKLRDSTYLGGTEEGMVLTVWNTGKWSDKWDTRIVELRSEPISFVRITSMSVAELGVHRVGFIKICKRPNENRRSMKFVTLSHFLYLRKSKLMSPSR